MIPPRGPRPRVLVLSRNYPNPAFPTLGLWTERLVQAAQAVTDCTVVAPVPWVPPLGPGVAVRRFRGVPSRETRAGVVVYHPRFPAAPGIWLHRFEASLQYPSIRAVTDQLHRAAPFHLIHAHMIYPEGVIAARLGRRYGVPVMTTEHVLWRPWLDHWPAVHRQVLEAAPAIRLVSAVSEAVRRSIAAVSGDLFRTAILPNVVDGEVFRDPAPDEPWDPDQILFVGAVRHVKGLDVLVRAMALLAPRRPALRLLVLGEAFYGQWRRDEMAVQRLVRELGLTERVIFGGPASQPEVAAQMRRSAALVVPARRESFSAVAIEALASGTPVVSTRCGGPEEFISAENGRLVDPENPALLAEAIDDVLEVRAGFDRGRLRAEVLSRFGVDAVTRCLEAIYGGVLSPPGRS